MFPRYHGAPVRQSVAEVTPQLRIETGQTLYKFLSRHHCFKWYCATDLEYLHGSDKAVSDGRTSSRPPIIEALTLVMDRRYPTGDKKRSFLQTDPCDALNEIFEATPLGRSRAARPCTTGWTWDTRGRSPARPARPTPRC